MRSFFTLKSDSATCVFYFTGGRKFSSFSYHLHKGEIGACEVFEQEENSNESCFISESPFHEGFQPRTWYEILVKIIPGKKSGKLNLR